MSNHNDNNDKNDKNNKRTITDINNYPTQPSKKHIIFTPILNKEYSEDNFADIISKNEEIIIIEKEINCLLDLIELGKLYVKNKRYNIDVKTLYKLIGPLSELNNMIGMETVKQDMVDHILFKIQKLDSTHQDIMHTVIQGPPGVGKTEVAKIIGKIYSALGI